MGKEGIGDMERGIGIGGEGGVRGELGELGMGLFIQGEGVRDREECR